MAAEVDSSAPGGPAGGAPTVEFGVVNYNGGEALIRCVRSVLEQEGSACRVTVFDNASTDGSVERLGEVGRAGVRVVRSSRNLGYAGALNRLVAELESDVVVLCNMDVEFDPDWVARVRAALAADEGADGVATVVVEATDPPVVNSVGVRFWGDLHAQNVGSGEPYDSSRVRAWREGAFGSYGAVLCVRRDTAAAVGFDESYFLFFEETDFLLRFHLLGHRAVFEPGAIARHQRSLSTRRYSPLKLYYGERNRLTTVFKLLPIWYWPVAGVHTIRRLLHLARRRPARTGGVEAEAAWPSAGTIVVTLLRAWGAAVLRLPRTLRARRRFWQRAPASPEDALSLLRRYELTAGELRVR